MVLMDLLFASLPHWLKFVLLRTGEWWNMDVDAMQSEMMKYGSGPNSSDAYTINGLPGPLYPCSNKGSLIWPQIPHALQTFGNQNKLKKIILRIS